MATEDDLIPWEQVKAELGLEEAQDQPAWKQLKGLLDDPAFVTTEPGEIDRVLGEAQEREHLETLNELIPALERVTKKRVELTDLLDYERE